MNYETQHKARMIKRMNNANERAETLIQRGQNARALWWSERAQMYADEIRIHEDIWNK